MIMTVPCLKDEELEGSVEPEHMMSDDGMDGRFVEAFIRDEEARAAEAVLDVPSESEVPEGTVVMEMPATPATEIACAPAETIRVSDSVSGVGWRVCFSF